MWNAKANIDKTKTKQKRHLFCLRKYKCLFIVYTKMSSFLASVKFRFEVGFKPIKKDQNKKTMLVQELFSAIDDLNGIDVHQLKINHITGNTYECGFKIKGREDDLDEIKALKLTPEKLAHMKVISLISSAESLVEDEDDDNGFGNFIGIINFDMESFNDSFEYHSNYPGHFFIPQETESYSSKRPRRDAAVDDLASVMDLMDVSEIPPSPPSPHRKIFRARRRSRSRSPPPIPPPHFGNHKGGIKTKRTIPKKRKTQKK